MTLRDFEAKIRKRCVISDSGCLEWQGAKTQSGYGVMRYNGVPRGVHRIMLAAKLNDASLLERCSTIGVHNQYALHSCDNPACCNPEHLRLGSAIDNGEDAKDRGRHGFRPNAVRKLEPDDVREIRSLGVTWDGMCDMMKKHRISQSSIQEVLARKTYKHVA